MADSLRQRARDAARVMAPDGVERLITSRHDRKLRRGIGPRTPGRTPPAEARVREAVRFLAGRGLTESSVRAASMPEDSLEYIAEVVTERLPVERPVRALHVGNFVGVSLSYVTCLVRDRHIDSVVVSVDPNITHRWIGDSQAHVIALLDHFNLLDNSLLIPGYTLQRTPEIQAEKLTGRYPLACENVLTSLSRVASESFDLVLLDGNHEEEHLAHEFEALRPLLAEGSIVVFDDVGTEGWPGVGKVFGRVLGNDGFAELGHDGRVGILQVRTSLTRVE